MRPFSLAAAAFLVGGLAACGTKAPAAATADCTGIPPLTGRVVDKAALLGPAAETRLVGELAALGRRTRDQLVVATLPSLGGRPIEDVGLAMGRCWGIGQKGLDNGVILLVAPAEKQVRIEVGTGLENLLKDKRAKAIIDEALVPAFKAGRFEAGIDVGVARIEAVLMSDTKGRSGCRRRRRDEHATDIPLPAPRAGSRLGGHGAEISAADGAGGR